MKILLTTTILLLGLAAGTAFGQSAEQGKTAYQVCAGCHGFKGEGNKLVNAPRLAGLEGWYLERQINNFRAGVRGSKAEDVHGKQMAMMAAAISSDAQVGDIVAYVATLPKATAPLTISGNAENGKLAYAPCITCHGVDGKGNKILNAPGLANLDDWYQLVQIEKFKSGLRGAHPDDTYGQQMAPMSRLLTDEQQVRDVIAYIHSLQD